ncbi:hypothetical protein E4U46_001429 [Claviceps purpurea]|nr:hypothetical protein E4U46_001429 [Claviceps purpurea]
MLRTHTLVQTINPRSLTSQGPNKKTIAQWEALEVLLHGVGRSAARRYFFTCEFVIHQTTFRKTSEPAKAFNGAPSEPTPANELSLGSASVAGFPSEALPAWDRIVALKMMLTETRSDAMREDIRSTIRRLFDEIE